MAKVSRSLHSCLHTRGKLFRRALQKFLRAYGDDIPEGEIRKATDAEHICNWTTWCSRDGRIQAAMRYDLSDWYLCTLKNAAVAPEQRGRGIGSRLYRATADSALKLKMKGYSRCHVLAADVTYTNAPSVRALKSAGFKTVNRFCWAKGEKPADILHFVRTRAAGGKACTR